MKRWRPLVAAAMLSAAGATHAQPAYPNKPIRMVVSATPGSQPDMIARIIAQKMNEAWGQPVVADNRAGAQGSIGVHAVVRAAPDGYTLLYVPPSFAINSVTMAHLPYDSFKDLTPVAHVGASTNVLVAHPSLGAKSVKELIAIAKAQPDKLILTSSTPGSAGYMSGVRFNLLTGIKALHVPFKGANDATIEVVAGRGHYHIGTMQGVIAFVREKKVVALAVTSPQRSPLLPEVPALGEILSEFSRPETSHGMLVPAATPRTIVLKLNAEIVRILGLPDVKEKLAAISFAITPSTPDEYASILRGQIEALRKVVHDSGMQVK